MANYIDRFSGGGGGSTDGFTQTFLIADWTAQQIAITAATHGKGANPNFEIYNTAGDKVNLDIANRDASGNITLTVIAGSEFDGEITII